jgi:hypothetical protein
MNPSEFNTKLNKLIDEAISEGIVKNKMGFETVIGIMEISKQSLMDFRRQAAMMQLQRQQAPLIQPANSIPKLP